MAIECIVSQHIEFHRQVKLFYKDDMILVNELNRMKTQFWGITYESRHTKFFLMRVHGRNLPTSWGRPTDLVAGG